MFQSIESKQFEKFFDEDRDNLEIIDVREEYEFEMIKIKGSKLIPMDEVLDNLDKIDWNKKVILVCHSGSRSGYIAQTLTGLGKEAVNLEGGIQGLQMRSSSCLER